MKVGDKFVKDGEVVEIIFNGEKLWFIDENDIAHTIDRNNFLEQYKPYEVVYEFQYAYRDYIDTPIFVSDRFFKNDEDFFKYYLADSVTYKTFQRLDFTKRERVQ